MLIRIIVEHFVGEYVFCDREDKGDKWHAYRTKDKISVDLVQYI